MARIAISVLASILAAGACRAQAVADPVRFPQVKLLFEQPQTKNQIACDVIQLKPDLNYLFRSQAGYIVNWPLKGYTGDRERFAVYTRVTPLTPDRPPVYFAQGLRLRTIPAKVKDRLHIDGAYFFGEGEYAIDLVLVDREDRFCRKRWQIKVKMPEIHSIQAFQEPGTVAPAHLKPWNGELLSANGDAPKRLTILMHVAPLYFWTNKLHAYDQLMLLSALLAVLQHSSFTDVKLVAFNLDQQTELYREERFDSQGWRKLVDAMHSLQLGTVSYQVLQNRTGHADLLGSLIEDELRAEQRADVVLFLGPTARQREKLRVEREEAEAAQPLFVYFEFKPYWRSGAEFPDILDHLTRSASGKVFRIHSPRELMEALDKMEQLSGRRSNTGPGLH